MTNPSNPNPSQTVIVNQVARPSNALGTAGFVLALIALFVGWIPVVGWIAWFLGGLFSFIGVFNPPRGMATAGLVISLIGLILLIAVFGSLFAGA